MAQVSLLIGAMSGLAWQIDMHMAYFAALGVLAVFADWTVILLAALTVALHHWASCTSHWKTLAAPSVRRGRRKSLPCPRAVR
jgi:hypothetical protein